MDSNLRRAQSVPLDSNDAHGYLMRRHKLAVHNKGRSDAGAVLAPGTYEGFSIQPSNTGNGQENVTYWIVSDGIWHLVSRSVKAGIIKVLETQNYIPAVFAIGPIQS